MAERARFDFEVIVVDNGSTDGGCAELESQFPQIRFIKSDYNRGFAAGCNLGLAHADPNARNYMLLNPDTEVMPGALNTLVEALNSHEPWGIVGPRMVDGQDQMYPAARRFPKPYDVFCECTRLAYLFPHSQLFARYFYGDCKLDQLDKVDQVEGSALVIKGSVRRAIGDLDEQFFLFWEEVDWCKRVQAAGFEVHVVQAATVRHFRATSMTKAYIFSRQENARSALKFFHKHHGNKGVQSLKRWMILGLWLREIGTRFLSLFSDRDLIKLRVEGARAERQIYRKGMESCL